MSAAKSNGIQRLVRCPYSELDAAYRKGRRDGARRKSLGDNPYPKPPDSKSRSFYPYGAWIRGFLAGKIVYR